MKSTDNFEQLQSELKNFQEIAQNIMPAPGEIPTLKGIEVYGGTIPLNGTVGGDHIIYIYLKNRYDLNARIRQASSEGRVDITNHL